MESQHDDPPEDEGAAFDEWHDNQKDYELTDKTPTPPWIDRKAADIAGLHFASSEIPHGILKRQIIGAMADAGREVALHFAGQPGKEIDRVQRQLAGAADDKPNRFYREATPPEAAARFSCHLERDFGKVPCAVDCGKLRCMYPTEAAASVQGPSEALPPINWERVEAAERGENTAQLMFDCGKAAGREEMRKELATPAAAAEPSDIADRVVQLVCEMDDRTSPEDWPEAMLVTGPELHAFVLLAFEREAEKSIAAPPEAAASVQGPSDLFEDACAILRGANHHVAALVLEQARADHCATPVVQGPSDEQIAAAWREAAGKVDHETIRRMARTLATPVVQGEQAAFEKWAEREGLFTVLAAENCSDGDIPKTDAGACPATYWRHETETAWRAWANKPAVVQREPVAKLIVELEAQATWVPSGPAAVMRRAAAALATPAAQGEPIAMWHARIKSEHPTSEPEYWPSSLKAQYMEAEILELRAAVASRAVVQGEPKRVKVARTCPRCNTRAYHRGNDQGIVNRIACVNCGHEWTGRITKDEQS